MFDLKAICVACVMLAGLPAQASTIVNGMFDHGLTGYTEIEPNPSFDFATVATLFNDNNFLSLEARAFVGDTGPIVFQTVMIDALHPILTFDAALLSEEATGLDTDNPSRDALGVVATPQGGGDGTVLFLLDNAGTLGSANAAAADLSTVFGTTQSAFSVTADLSAFVGQTVDLSFSGSNFAPLATTTFFGVDNIALGGAEGPAPEVVPLPLPAMLLLTGCVALGAMRRRRG